MVEEPDIDAIGYFHDVLTDCELKESKADMGETARIEWSASQVTNRQEIIFEAEASRNAAIETKEGLYSMELFATLDETEESLWDDLVGIMYPWKVSKALRF